MVRKLPRIFFYLSTLTLIAVLLAWWYKYIEVIAAINYTLYTLPGIIFFLNWSIWMKHRPRFRWVSFALTLFGGIFWELALLRYLDFEDHWNWTFVCMISGLLMSIYGKTTRHTRLWLKVASFASMLLLLLCIWLTSMSMFTTSITLIVALGLYTTFTMMSQFMKVNPRH